jgi:hypothetical protein
LEFSPIQTEQTSAVTDVLLVLVTAYSIYRLRPFWRGPGIRGMTWVAAFCCIGVASFMGAVVHGFDLSPAGERFGRMPVNLFVGLAASSFAIGTIFDALGERITRRLLSLFLALGSVIPLITMVFPRSFFLLTIYGGSVLLSSMLAYVILSFRGKPAGARWVAAGILVSIVGALIQATQAVHFTFLWEFDHNGTLHLIQLLGMFVLLKGLLAGFREDASKPAGS